MRAGNKTQPMIRLLLLSTLLISAANGCDSAETFELDEPFSLAIGETMACSGCGDFAVTAVAVKEDSRCPKGVNCIQAGRAVISMQAGGETFDLALEAGKGGGAQQAVGDYVVKLQEVAPYPEDGVEITTEDYRLQLLVERIPTR